MRFPDHFIEEVKSRVVLSDIIGRRHKVVRSGKSLKICCPFHHEKTPSCYVYDNDGHYHCFGCGAHGDVIEYLMKQENLSFHDSIAYLAKEYGLALPTPEKESPEAEKEKSRREYLYGLLEDVATWYEGRLWSPQGNEAKKYLKGRSFSKEIITRFRLGFAPAGSPLLREFHQTRGVSLKDLEEVGLVITDSDRGEPYDRFRGRLMFPIMNKQGKVIAFGGRRLLSEKGPKYLNSPETPLFHKGAELYGHHFAARHDNRNDPLIVCEGYTDAMSLSQAGYSRVVAPLGTALTERQISLVWRLSKAPILCFDGDMAGSRAAERAAETALPLLTPEKTLQFLSLPEGEDPASLLDKGGRDRFQRLIDTKCRPVVDLLWRACEPHEPLKTPEEKAKVRKKISAFVAQIKDSDLRESYQGTLKDFYEAFLQKSRPASRNSFPANKNAFGTKTSSYGFPTRQPAVERPELDATYVREAVLMYALVYFPSLIRDYEEDIVHFDSETESFGTLKECLVELINEFPDLDRSTLKAHLYERDFKNVVDFLKTPRIALHASFAHPDKPLSEVRPLFEAYLKSGSAKKLALGDIKEQAVGFASHMSDEEWKRIQHRRELVASMVAEEQAPFDDREY